MTNHMDSLVLENACRSALNVNSRGAFYGMVDADYIDRVGNGFSVLAVAVAPYYKVGNTEERARIEHFLARYNFLGHEDCDVDEYSSGLVSAAEDLRRLVDTF